MDLRVVIFSKDRPLQLDAALRSLKANAPDIGTAEIRVLYAASRPAFSSLYRVLAGEHPDVRLWRESEFRTDLIDLVRDTHHVLFLVDDTLIVRPFSAMRAVQALEDDESTLGISLRLGCNTTYCYTLDKAQRLPDFEEVGSDLLRFDWTSAEFDFGYPLELSSSIYRTCDVLPLLTSLEYWNPNTLESELAQRASTFSAERPRLGCFTQSVAFSVPANMVQTAWTNRIDGNPGLSADALAERYLRGERLDVDRFRGFVPSAAHEEVPFEYLRQNLPTVSVVIPCFGQAEYLPDAVASVARQTFTEWEIVIVDDGSPDNTAEVAGHLIEEHGPKVRLIRQANSGLAGARNAGVLAARGRYILPLDADDMIDPKMLESAVEMLEREADIAIIYTDLQQFGDRSDLIHASDFDAARLPEANQLNYCSLFRREVWEAVGGYNPNMKWGYEDWDFWVGAAEHGYVARRIPEALFRYRIRPNSMISTALQHTDELRHQMRTNHPATFRRSAWLMRCLRATSGTVKRRLGRAVDGPSRAREA